MKIIKTREKRETRVRDTTVEMFIKHFPLIFKIVKPILVTVKLFAKACLLLIYDNTN